MFSRSFVSLGQENDFRHLPLGARETIVARFEERVNAALHAGPPTKDLVKRAVKRQGALRCPVRVKRFSYDVILRYGDALADLFANEHEVRRLLDALAEYLVALIRSWGEMGVDAIFLTDDWGTQTSLTISPAMWRGYFKDHYRKIFDETHQLGNVA